MVTINIPNSNDYEVVSYYKHQYEKIIYVKLIHSNQVLGRTL